MHSQTGLCRSVSTASGDLRTAVKPIPMVAMDGCARYSIRGSVFCQTYWTSYGRGIRNCWIVVPANQVSGSDAWCMAESKLIIGGLGCESLLHPPSICSAELCSGKMPVQAGSRNQS